MAKVQFQQKNTGISPKRILSLVLPLLIVFLLFASVLSLSEKYFALRKRVHALKEEKKELEQKKAELITTNAYIETPEGEEKVLREKYNVVRPGEEMIIITNTESVQEPTGPSTRIGRWWDTLLKGLGMRK